MNDQRIAIITDSGTDTPPDFVREHDVRIVPLLITYSDGHTYKSGVDITTDDVVSRIDEEIPKTSLPAPTQMMEAFEKAKADGYTSAVFVSISAALSGTNQMARFVGNEMKDFPVIAIDTKSIGLIAGMIVMEAVRLVEAGVPFDQLEERLVALSEKSTVYFTTKTLYYLRQGGRISEAVYRLGEAFKIKPVIWCDEHGYYQVAKKTRGWKKAIQAEIDFVKEQASRFANVRVGICSSMGKEMLDELEASIRQEVPNLVEVVRSGISPDLVVHTGPDMVGMGVVPVVE